MQLHNRQRLEKYRSAYNGWVNDRVLANMDGAAINEILSVIREEWDPGYTVQAWCGHCRAEMITYAFEKMDADKENTEVLKVKF